jgi:hypothetical protein
MAATRKGSVSAGGGKANDKEDGHEVKSDKCGDCGMDVLDRQKGVECEVCEYWFHCKCQKVSDEVYKCINDNRTVHWYCSGCNKGVAKILRTMVKIQERQDIMEETEKFKGGMDGVRVEWR